MAWHMFCRYHFSTVLHIFYYYIKYNLYTSITWHYTVDNRWPLLCFIHAQWTCTISHRSQGVLCCQLLWYFLLLWSISWMLLLQEQLLPELLLMCKKIKKKASSRQKSVSGFIFFFHIQVYFTVQPCFMYMSG